MTNRINRVVTSIQQMNNMEAEGLFKLVQTEDCPFTSNNHGVFLNFRWISPKTLERIEKFIEYCSFSREQLEKVENIQEEWNKTMDSHTDEPVCVVEARPKKVKTAITYAIEDAQDEIRKPRNTSITRFGLLKKKFQRVSNCLSEWDDYLEPEEYCYP